MSLAGKKIRPDQLIADSHLWQNINILVTVYLRVESNSSHTLEILEKFPGF